MQTKKY